MSVTADPAVEEDRELRRESTEHAADHTHSPLEFSRQEYWTDLPFPNLGDLPDPGIKPTSPALAGGFFATWEAHPYI